MSQPAPIPQYLLVLGILILVVSVPLCSCPITFIGCQPRLLPPIFPRRDNRKPILPIRKKHAAPSENPALKEASTPTGAALNNPAHIAALSLLSGRSGVAGDEKIDRIYEELRKK